MASFVPSNSSPSPKASSPRGGGMAGFNGSPHPPSPSSASSGRAAVAQSIRLADADIEYVRGQGGATHTWSQGQPNIS